MVRAQVATGHSHDRVCVLPLRVILLRVLRGLCRSSRRRPLLHHHSPPLLPLLLLMSLHVLPRRHQILLRLPPLRRRWPRAPRERPRQQQHRSS
jgi:hypothetical protein